MVINLNFASIVRSFGEVSLLSIRAKRMNKHMNFWIGWFTAAFVVVFIAVGAWGVATDQALEAVAWGFGLTLALTVLLCAVLFFRARLLRFFLNTTEASIEELASHSFELIGATTRGDKELVANKTQMLVRSFLGWYAWSSFYRWVIRTNMALLIAFGGFAGTVLLFEQNRRLEEQTIELIGQRKQLEEQNSRFDIQNELLGLSLTSELRERLRPVADKQKGLGLTRNTVSTFGDTSGHSCTLSLINSALGSVSNASSVEAVAKLAQSQYIGKSVVSTLETLLKDDDDGVALGALVALDSLGKVPPGTRIFISGKSIFGLNLQSDVDISFSNSFLLNFRCSNCTASLFSAVSVSSVVNQYLIVEDSIISNQSIMLPEDDWLIPTSIENIENSLVSGVFSIESGIMTSRLHRRFDSPNESIFVEAEEYSRTHSDGTAEAFIDDIISADVSVLEGEEKTRYCRVLGNIDAKNEIVAID